MQKNSNRHYTKLADAVGEALQGELAGQRAIAALHDGTAHPDVFYTELQTSARRSPDFLRGFAKALRKFVENHAS